MHHCTASKIKNSCWEFRRWILIVGDNSLIEEIRRDLPWPTSLTAKRSSTTNWAPSYSSDDSSLDDKESEILSRGFVCRLLRKVCKIESPYPIVLSTLKTGMFEHWGACKICIVWARSIACKILPTHVQAWHIRVAKYLQCHDHFYTHLDLSPLKHEILANIKICIDLSEHKFMVLLQMHEIKCLSLQTAWNKDELLLDSVFYSFLQEFSRLPPKQVKGERRKNNFIPGAHYGQNQHPLHFFVGHLVLGKQNLQILLVPLLLMPPWPL